MPPLIIYTLHLLFYILRTLWVGNLCEFVTDETLSELFQETSSLKFVPACVARKANMESLRYGFVTFRSEKEKEVSYILYIFGDEYTTRHYIHVCDKTTYLLIILFT